MIIVCILKIWNFDDQPAFHKREHTTLETDTLALSRKKIPELYLQFQFCNLFSIQTLFWNLYCFLRKDNKFEKESSRSHLVKYKTIWKEGRRNRTKSNNKKDNFRSINARVDGNCCWQARNREEGIWDEEFSIGQNGQPRTAYIQRVKTVAC